MPTDKIKDVYDLISDKGYFTDENEFRSYVNDPKKIKEVYTLIQDDGFFKDEKEFEGYFSDVKKKEPAISLGYKTTSELLESGVLPKQEKPSALKTAATTTPSVSTKSAEIKLQPLNIEQIKAATTKSTADIGKPDVPKQVIPKTDIKADQGSIADLSIKKQKYTDDLNLANQEYLRLEQEYAPIMEELDVLGKEYEATQDPELAKQYNNLYLQAKPALDKMKMFSENEKILSAGLRNVEQMQDANYEKNYGVGSMVKRGFGNTVANIVNSTGKIIETFGDLAAQNSFAAAYAPEALAQEDDKLTDQLARDIDEYYKRINEAVNREVPKSFASYSPLSDKPSAAKLLDFGINAFSQLAPTVVAGLTTGGVGAAAMGFTMEFGSVYDTFHDPIKQRYIKQGLSEKEAEVKADLEAGLMSTGVATIIGQLDKFGATEMINAVSKKALAKKITQDALVELGEKTGKEAAETAIKKSLVQNLAAFGKGYGKTVLPEATTEPIQELVAPATADVYEALTGEDVFEEGLGDKQTWINAGNAAVGALMASSPMGVISGASGITTQGYKKAVSMKDPAEFDKFNAILTAEVESGITTPEQAQEAIEVIKKVQAADKQIPSTIQSEVERTTAANLLIEKQNITAEIEGKDAALVAPQKERIKEIDAALSDIASGNFIKELETTTEETDGEGTIEGTVSAGTDVAEEGLGVATEPSGEGITGEGVQAETVPQTPVTAEEIETRRQETEAKIKRRDLFIGVGDFSTELGGSDLAAVPFSHKEKNGIEFVEYAHPKTGSVDVIVTGKSGNDFVGFYRIYENGNPTNKWSSKFENQSRNKEDFKTMISGVQEMLPAGHEYTEKTSISTDGLRVWNQQLERGYELQYDENGKLITNRVFINGDAIVNELGIPVDKGNFDRIRVTTREDFEKVKAKLLPYIEKFGLDESSIKWISGNVEVTPQNEKAFASTASVKIDLPVLKNNKVAEVVSEKVTEVTTPAIEVTPTEKKEVVSETVSGKPTKTERKAIAEAKIDDLAARAKEFLRNKNLPEGTQVSGVSQDKVIDLMASTVKALVNSGIEISEAIKQVREFFEQDFDTSAVKDYEIAQAIARDELTDVAKDNGFSSYREAVFAVNKYVREVGKEDVITKAEIEKAAKEKTKSEEEAKKAKSSEKKGYTGRKKVSKFYKTALAYVQNTPTRLQDFLKANPLSYGVVTNAESIKKAIDFIEENGFEETLKDFLTKQIKTDGEFEKIIFVGYLLRGGLSEAFTDISKSMNGVTDADELAALKKEADRIFNDMKAVTTLLAEGYFPSFGRAIQAGALFAQDLSTEDGAIFHFTKLTEQAAAKAREVNKQEATEQVNTVKEVVEEGTVKAAKAVTEYIVKSKDVQARNATKLSKARKAAADAKEKLKAALAKYKILGIANDPWEQAKNDVATIKALTDYVAAQLKYKSVQAGQVIKEVAALLGINERYIPKADIQEIMDAAKVQAEKDMTFDEITNVTTPKGVVYAERVGKELSNDPSAINKTVESIIQDYYMGNQTLDEIIDMVKQRFDVTDAQAITIAKQIQSSINDNITKALEKQLDKKIKQLNDKRLKEEGKKPPKERKPVKSLYDIMAQAQVMGVLDTDSVQAILEELYNVPTVTPEDIQFVKDTYAKINSTGDLTRKSQLIADLHKRFANKNPISFYDVYNSYWYSAVLSGPSTTDVNVQFGLIALPFAVADMISGAFINSVKIIADKFKGKQNPSSVALEARLIFDSMWRTVFQTGTLNTDAIKRGSLFKMESLPLYESFQNLVSTLKRGPQAFNEELRNTDISVKDNAYLKDYKPTGILGKLISPLIWIDKKIGVFSFLPKYVPRAINAVDIFFGTALKNLNLAQTLKTYYVKQGLSGKELATAIKSDLYKSPELLFAARELAANDRLNIDLEIKKENGEFVVYDTGKKKKSFRTESAAKKYMAELSYQGDKYQKGVVDYLNATLPPDVIDATRRIAAGYVCTGEVEGTRSKWVYNNIILNMRKATMDWADSKKQNITTRVIKFATSRVFEFMKFPLNFNNLGIAYTAPLAFLRAKYTGDEASLYAQVYKDKAEQRFLTGFVAFMALTTPTLLSMLVLKSPDDEEEENKEDLKRRQELADKFFKDTGEKIDIDNPLFNLPKDGELVGSLSFLPANTKKFLKENNLAVPFRRWNAKLNIWEDYTISPLVYNLTMAASLADYVKYVINDKTKFNSVAQRAKEWGNVASYFAGNLVQTFVNAAGIKSQNQLLLTLNSNNYERKINAAVDMLFSPVQSTPALLRQLSDGLDMRLKQRVESVDKPFEYVASKTIPLGSLFYTGRKKHDMFGDEIAYLTGADRGFVLKHLFSVTQKEYEKQRTDLGQFLNINGYSKYRDLVTEYEKKNTEIIDIKKPTVEINGISYTNYLDKGFTDEEMSGIGLAAAKRAKQVLISNKATLQKIGNATDLSNIPLVSANYTIPFTESIDFIYDTIFKEEWESALIKKKYVSEIGENVYEANKTKSTIITDMLNVILTKTPVEKIKPIETKIPIEFNNLIEGD